VRVQDSNRVEVYRETVTLEAGGSKAIRVPKPVPPTTPVVSTSEQTSTVPEPISSALSSSKETSTLTRRLLIGGGIAAALGGGGLMLNKLSPTSKGLNTPASEKLKVDAQLTETSTIYRTAARGIRRQYPRLADYVESLCVIPARDFQMGSVKYDDEKPVHKVSLSSFGLGATPVTVALWEEYAIAKLSGVMPPEPNPSGFDGAQKFNIGWKDLDHPIVNVSWDDCRDFCAWASEVSGIALDLPSEAQWEYACRGGVSSLEFPWGGATDDVSVRNFLTANVWCSDAKLGDRGGTGSVNRTTRIWRNHPWKLIDMVGNVWEWCVDHYDPEWYGRSQATGPDVVNRTFAPTQTVKFVDGSSNERPTRCVRGGSWYSTYPVNFRCANRFRNAPDDRYFIFGFRLSAGPG
jgi:formylglycine-generating enzyme required for sulfatase activity